MHLSWSNPPYKAHNATWPLQKAIEVVFHQALTSYAINDLFATTTLFFYIQTIRTMSCTLNTSQPNPQTELPFFLVIGDSHGRNLDPETITSQFIIITKGTSDLQWYQPYQQHLCAQSLVNSSCISPSISTCSGVLLWIGTNSVRNTPAFRIIWTSAHFIESLRTTHPHLTGKHDISVFAQSPV